MTSSSTTISSDLASIMNENTRLLQELQNEVSELHQLNQVSATRRNVYAIVEPSSNDNHQSIPSSTNKNTIPSTPNKSSTTFTDHPTTDSSILSYHDLINANTNTLEQFMGKVKEASLSARPSTIPSSTKKPTPMDSSNNNNNSSSSLSSSFVRPPSMQDTVNPDVPSLPSNTPVSSLDAVHARLATLEAEIQNSNKAMRTHTSKAETSKSLLEAYLRNDNNNNPIQLRTPSSTNHTSLLTPLSFKQAFNDANQHIRPPPSRPAPKIPPTPTSTQPNQEIPSSSSTTTTAPTSSTNNTQESTTKPTMEIQNKENTLPSSSSTVLQPSQTVPVQSTRSSSADSMEEVGLSSSSPTTEELHRAQANNSISPPTDTVKPSTTATTAPPATASSPRSTNKSPNLRPRTPVSRIFVTDVDPTEMAITALRGRSITKFKHPQDNKSKLTTLTDVSSNVPDFSNSSANPLQSSSMDLKSPLSVRIAQYRTEPGQFDERMLAAKGRLIAQATLSSSTGITADEQSETGTITSPLRSPSRSPSRTRAPLTATAPVPNFGHILSGAHRLQHYQYGPSTAELLAMQQAQEAAEAEARRIAEIEAATRRQAEAEARAAQRALREAALKKAQEHKHELDHKPSFFSAEEKPADDTDPTLKAAAQIFANKKNNGPFARLGARALLKAAAHSIMEAHEATSPSAERVKAKLEGTKDDKIASLVKFAAQKAVAEGSTNLHLGNLSTRTRATHRGQLAREVQQLMTRQNIHHLQQTGYHNPYQTREGTSASAVTGGITTTTTQDDLQSPSIHNPEVVTPIVTADINDLFSATHTNATNNVTNSKNNVVLSSPPVVVTPLPTPTPTPANTETVPTSASAMTASPTPTETSPAPKKKGFAGMARSVLGVFSSAKKSKDNNLTSPTGSVATV